MLMPHENVLAEMMESIMIIQSAFFVLASVKLFMLDQYSCIANTVYPDQSASTSCLNSCFLQQLPIMAHCLDVCFNVIL